MAFPKTSQDTVARMRRERVLCAIALTCFLTAPSAFFLSTGSLLQGPLYEFGRLDGLLPLVAGAGIALISLGIMLAASAQFRALSVKAPAAGPLVCWVVALALSTVALWAPGEGYAACFAASGVLYGAGSVAFLLRIREVLREQSDSLALGLLGASFAAAAVVPLAAFMFSNSAVMLAMTAATAVAAGLLLALLPRPRASEASSTDIAEASPAASATFSKSSFWKQKLGRLLPALSGTCVCAVVLGFACGTALPQNNFAFAGVITRATFAGFSLCSCAAVAAALLMRDSSHLESRLVALCPIMVALPSIPCIAPMAPDGITGTLFGLMTGMGYGYFAITTSWILSRPSRPLSAASGSPLPFSEGLRACGVAFASAAVSFGAPSLAGPLLNDQLKTTVSLGLFLAYLVAFAMASRVARPAHVSGPEDASNSEGVKEQDRGTSHKDNQGTGSPSDLPSIAHDPIEARCAQLREECGLSPREEEVLNLLARGRTGAYIAEALFVSRETVKVHVRHIYEKLGVHSRQELLDLFQGNTSSPRAK